MRIVVDRRHSRTLGLLLREEEAQRVAPPSNVQPLRALDNGACPRYMFDA